MFMFLFLLFSMLLLSSFLRLKELFQVKNGLTTSLLFVLFCFFFLIAKKLGRSDDAKRRKKRGWPKSQGEQYGRRVHVRRILGEG